MRTIHLILLFSLFGCASLGEKFQTHPFTNKEKSLVYVYRVPRFAGSAGSPYLCIDDQVVGEVLDGGYFTIEVNPGNHKISTKSLGTQTKAFDFTTIAGKTYYLRSDFSSLKTGTGAGLVGDAIWGTSSEEKKKLISQIDESAQKMTEDASLIFVKSDFAKSEIIKNKKFNIPKYDKNYCEKTKNMTKKRKRH